MRGRQSLWEHRGDKVVAVNSYLEHLESDPRRVRSLAGWDWTDEAVQNLPTSFAAFSD